MICDTDLEETDTKSDSLDSHFESLRGYCHCDIILVGLLPAHVKQQRGPCVNMKQMNIPNAQLLNCFPLHPPLSHDDR